MVYINFFLSVGNSDFESKIVSQLQDQYFFFNSYHTIFKIFENEDAGKELEKLKGSAVIGLELRKITMFLPNGMAKKILSESLDNILTLYYVNL